MIRCNIHNPTDNLMSDSSLDCKIYQSIHQVPIEQWDSLALKYSITYSSDFWKLLEDSNIGGLCSFNYLILFDNNTPVCVAACYTYRVDLGFFIGSFFDKVLHSIRSISPNFLKIRILECGTPINIHSPPFIVADCNQKDTYANIILKYINKLGRNNKIYLIGIKDINDSLLCDVSFTNILKTNSFTLFRSEPNSYINLCWNSMEHYRSSMKSYYRCKLDKYIKINVKRRISTEIIEDFSDAADVLAKQWLTVFQKASGIKREQLNAEFFRLYSSIFEDKSKTILFYENEKIVGHALLFVDNDQLRWLYTGKQKPTNDSLYMYIAYKVVELGIELGVKRIHFGPTTYSIKQDFGARIDYLHYALKVNKPLSWFISTHLIKSYIEFDPPENKSIFKNIENGG